VGSSEGIETWRGGGGTRGADALESNIFLSGGGLSSISRRDLERDHSTHSLRHRAILPVKSFIPSTSLSSFHLWIPTKVDPSTQGTKDLETRNITDELPDQEEGLKPVCLSRCELKKKDTIKRNTSASSTPARGRGFRTSFFLRTRTPVSYINSPSPCEGLLNRGEIRRSGGGAEKSFLEGRGARERLRNPQEEIPRRIAITNNKGTKGKNYLGGKELHTHTRKTVSYGKRARTNSLIFICAAPQKGEGLGRWRRRQCNRTIQT